MIAISFKRIGRLFHGQSLAAHLIFLVCAAPATCAGSDTALAVLTDSVGSLTPPFSPSVHEYTQIYDLPFIAVRALANDGKSKVEARLNDGEFKAIVEGNITDLGSVLLAIKADGTVTTHGAGFYGEHTIPAGLADVVSVAAGDGHCVALKGDGTVVAWGRNNLNQTVVPPGLSDVRDIVAFGNASIALRNDGTVVTWGNIGAPPPFANDLVAIAASSSHTLGLKRDGSVVTWGSSLAYLAVPPGLIGVTAIGAGPRYSTALLADGSLVSWGDSIFGAGNAVVSIPGGLAALSPQGGCALRLDGSIVAWRDGNSSEGNPPAVSGFLSVSGSASFGHARAADGTVTMWSNQPYPAEDIVAATDSCFIPMRLLPGMNRLEVRVIAEDSSTASYQVDINRTPNTRLQSLSLMESLLTPEFSPGTLAYSAGVSYSTASITLRASPADPSSTITANGVPITPGTDLSIPLNVGVNTVQVVSAAEGGTATGETTLVITRRAAPQGVDLRMLGSSSPGLMTSFAPEISTYSIPNPPAVLTLWPRSMEPGVVMEARSDDGGWQRLSPGGVCPVSVALTFGTAAEPNGRVTAWGSNSIGQLNLPAGMSGVSEVSAAYYHGLALTEEGRVFGWGMNGDGPTYAGQAAVPASLPPVSAARAGYTHSLAVSRTGAVHAWGSNGSGQSGIPAALPPIASIACGTFHSAALARDGRVFTWGTLTQGTVPPAVNGVTVDLGAGKSYCAAVKSDGKVTAWGTNADGALNVPPALSNVVAVACGNNHALALKADGTVTAWGRNQVGQASVPVGLSNVVAISAGGDVSMALKQDGTLLGWGDNATGQRTFPDGLTVFPARSWFRHTVHAGPNKVEVRLTSADEAASRTYSVTMRGSFLNLYSAWTATAFPAATPAALKTFTADPDADGMANALEYLFGSLPLIADDNPVSVRVDDADCLVEFPRRNGLENGLESIEMSDTTDGGWVMLDNSAAVRTDHGAGQPQTVTFRLPRDTARKFIRVRVTL